MRQPFDHIAFAIAARDEQDGKLRADDLAHHLCHLWAVHVRQMPVENQQVEGFRAQVLEQRRAGGVGAADVFMLLQSAF